MLVRNGMRTVQVIGVPEGPLPEADAVIVALKSRTAPVGEAVAQSLAALDALLAAGAKQALFKICSTFDSTDAGISAPWRMRCCTGCRPASPWPALPSRPMPAASTRAISSSAARC